MKKFFVLLGLLLASNSWAATCTVTEFERLATDPAGRVLQVGVLPHVASQLVTYTTSTQSTAFNNSTNYIRIQCDAAAHFVVGTNPTATTAAPRIPAGGVEYFAVTTDGLEIAFYDGTS